MDLSRQEVASPAHGKKHRRIMWAAYGLLLVATLVILYFLWAKTSQKPEKYDDTATYGAIATTTTDITFPDDFTEAQKVDYLMGEASTLSGAGKPKEALVLLQKAEVIAGNGAYPLLLSTMGDTYILLGDSAKARQAYEKALAKLDASNLPDKSDFKTSFEDKIRGVK